MAAVGAVCEKARCFSLCQRTQRSHQRRQDRSRVSERRMGKLGLSFFFDPVLAGLGHWKRNNFPPSAIRERISYIY